MIFGYLALLVALFMEVELGLLYFWVVNFRGFDLLGFELLMFYGLSFA